MGVIVNLVAVPGWLLWFSLLYFFVTGVLRSLGENFMAFARFIDSLASELGSGDWFGPLLMLGFMAFTVLLYFADKRADEDFLKRDLSIDEGGDSRTSIVGRG